jgi:hypothetical protein
MATRKIAECLNVRINVGNYQHIELTKYAEEEISYDTYAERISKEDILRDDLVDSLIRSMKAIPEKLGKGVENAIEVEESIGKAIPKWLENDTVPNIANNAKKKMIQVAAEQKDNKDSQSKVISVEEIKPEQKDSNPKNETVVTEENLFEDDAPDIEEISLFEDDNANKKTVETSEEKKYNSDELDDFFGGAEDDDLFGDK